jgi:YfiH family protein
MTVRRRRSAAPSNTAAETTAGATPVPLRADVLSALPWLRHGFSTRAGGVSTAYSERGAGELNCGRTPEDTEKNVAENRRRFIAALSGPRGAEGIARASTAGRPELLHVHQIHSAIVWRDPAPGAAGDGLFTAAAMKAVSVRVADCVPILIADRRLRAVAAVHAGWRGTVQHVAERAVGEMRRDIGSDPADLVAAIGPSIRRCCYEVGNEVIEAFESQFDYTAELLEPGEPDPVHSRYPMLFMTGAPPGHPYDPRWNRDLPARLDLAEANRRQLIATGLAADSIEVMPYCTSCRRDLFFSHRRDQGVTGRMMAAAFIASDRRDA